MTEVGILAKPLRQYCLELELRDEENLIREYGAFHEPGHVWPEVIESIQRDGVVDMQIYRSGVRLVMVMTVSDDFSFEAKARNDAGNPRVAEWERLMERFQNADDTKPAKWRRMRNIFNLQKHV